MLHLLFPHHCEEGREQFEGQTEEEGELSRE